MVKKQLYTGNSVYLTEHQQETLSDSGFVRLIADDGRAITNGETITEQADVPVDYASLWQDCPLPPEDAEATEADYQQALQEMGVRL